MASDWMGGGKFVPGNSPISLSLHCTSDEEIKTLFDGLSAGGKVTQPLADQFWGDTFGTLVDKFGIAWMLNARQGSALTGLCHQLRICPSSCLFGLSARADWHSFRALSRSPFCIRAIA